MSASFPKPRGDLPEYEALKQTNKDVQWYNPNIDDKVTPEIRNLLETYSKIPPSEVLQHVNTMRDKAWEIRSYPCTGLGIFLTSLIQQSPAYPTMIEKLQAGASLLEIGCFIGHDLRRLVFDGAPSDRLCAVDIVSHWDVGFDMFRDRDKFNPKFIECNILAPTTELLALGSFDIIYSTHVLHQWDWTTQVKAIKQLIALSAPGAMVAGFQGGVLNGKVKTFEKTGAMAYVHDPETFQRVWDEAAKGTGTKWKSDAVLKPWEEVGTILRTWHIWGRMRGFCSLS